MSLLTQYSGKDPLFSDLQDVLKVKQQIFILLMLTSKLY